jgi:hypothetical protein
MKHDSLHHGSGRAVNVSQKSLVCLPALLRKSFKRSPYNRAFRRKDNSRQPESRFLEDLFVLKGFQRIGGVVNGVVGFGGSLRNRYRNGDTQFPLSKSVGEGDCHPSSIIRWFQYSMTSPSQIPFKVGLTGASGYRSIFKNPLLFLPPPTDQFSTL